MVVAVVGVLETSHLNHKLPVVWAVVGLVRVVVLVVITANRIRVVVAAVLEFIVLVLLLV